MSASMLTPRNFLFAHVLVFRGFRPLILFSFRDSNPVSLFTYYGVRVMSACACDQQGLPGSALEPIISIKFLKGLEPYFCLHLGTFSLLST